MTLETTGIDPVHLAHGLMAVLGFPVQGDTADTPARFVKALAELTAGLRAPYNPAEDLSRTFDPPSGDPHMVIARDVPFTTMCEHHWLPFTGRAAVAYVPKPGGQVVGLSKLARVVTGFASAPTMQERLGEQITQALMTYLDADGAGCLLEAEHTCMTLRGIRATGATTLTSHLRGRFYEAPMRQEFLALAGAR